MAPFGGFDMPIQYEGILAEHESARTLAVVFDTCHMGEFSISGSKAAADLDRIVSCPVASMQIGQCRYGLICSEDGGVIDDQILYRMGENDFLMVVNSSTQLTDFEWIKKNISSNTSLVDLSEQTGKIDLQGPKSPQVATKLFERPIDQLRYYHWMRNVYRGKEILMSRTGYTGEIGFEVYLDERQTVQFWNDCIALGAKPAGLGARDTLRLEMGFPLYGHELNRDRNALESGLSKAIAAEKDFIGAKIVSDRDRATSSLRGIRLEGRRTSRSGDQIRNERGETIGSVTSGSFSPSLGVAIALGYVALPFCATGNRVIIAGQKSDLPGTLADLPFYRAATARRPISDFLVRNS